ncbi:MAG: hypothetical protein AAFY50_02330 [Cyanobacteria bacterium J06648_1]
MNNTTFAEIKTINTSLEVLSQFGIELNLEEVLAEELEKGLASDVNSIL